MAHLYADNSIFIWSFLFITCFSLQLVCGFSQFSKIEHFGNKGKDKSISFLVVGDWGRGGLYNQSLVATQMGVIGKKLDINFVVSAGDNFYSDGLTGVDDPAFSKSFTNVYTAKSLQKPWYVVLGNHDYQGDALAQLSPALKKRDNRWNCARNFFVRAGMADIFFIDTNPLVNKYFDNPKKQKFDWRGILPRQKYISDLLKSLDSELRKSKAPWKIVVGHQTIMSIGYHGDTKEVVDQILPILEANNVDMYINGHDHCLQHLSNKNGTMHFLTSGGGSKAWKNIMHPELHDKKTTHFYHDGQGFISVKISDDKAKIEYYDVSGKTIYSFKIKS